MNKKLIALLLALILLLSMGSAACAAEADLMPQETEITLPVATDTAEEQDVPDATASPTKPGADATGDEEEAGSTFDDVAQDAYYFDAVNWAVEQEITQGMGDGLFVPDATCTRAQVVTFLWRLAGTPTPQPPKFMFTDVAVGSWYDEAVLWAVENKVTDGMGEGIFLPDGTCTRSQIVTFLWKYAGKPSADAQNPFSDVAEDAWYAEAVLWAVDRGITTGLSETTFGPDAPCTRGQIVTFLYRYAGIEDEQPAETEPVETEPNETEPAVTEPIETEPAETEPTQTEPGSTEPEPTKPDWGMGGEDF